DRLHHARIGSATAEVAVHVRANLCFGGAWILRQQLGALDQHSVVAIAALRRLLVDERLLQRMEHWRLREPLLLCVERREALERGQRFVGDPPHPAPRGSGPRRGRGAPSTSRIAPARSRSAVLSARARSRARKGAACPGSPPPARFCRSL